MWEAPAPGDIVWCRFPQRPRDVPGPKPRPALVVAVTEHEDGISVKVAYGTSQKVDRLRAGEFTIRRAVNKAAFEAAGLSYDTKFDLGSLVDLPWDDSFFAVPPRPAHGQTPKLGSLHIGMRRALEAAVRALKPGARTRRDHYYRLRSRHIDLQDGDNSFRQSCICPDSLASALTVTPQFPEKELPKRRLVDDALLAAAFASGAGALLANTCPGWAAINPSSTVA